MNTEPEKKEKDIWEIDAEYRKKGFTRCVSDHTGNPAYVRNETASNKHWQRSTGYKPKPLPEKTELPKMVEQPEPQPVQTEATPAKKKGGRPSKNTQLT